MAIVVTCPCGKEFTVAEEFAGRRIICKECRQTLLIPSASKKTEMDAPRPQTSAPARQTPPAAAPPQIDEVEVVADEEPGGYALNAIDAKLRARLRGTAAAEEKQDSGELGCFRLGTADQIVTCLACALDNRTALASLESTIFVLDFQTGRIPARFQKQERRIRSVAVSPDGRYALSGDVDSGLLLWEIAGDRALRWLQGHQGKVETVTFGPGGHFALSGGEDGRVLLWDLRRGEVLVCLEKNERTVTSVAFSPDGRLALTGDSGGNVRLWDVTSGRWLANLEGPALGSISCVAFTGDGGRALAGGRSRVLTGTPPVSRWDLQTGRRLRCGNVPATPQTTIRSVAFFPDGRRVLAGGGMSFSEHAEGFDYDFEAAAKICTTPVRLWDLDAGQVMKSFEGHARKRTRIATVQDVPTVHCVAFAPDARRGLSGGNDGAVRVWGLPV